MSSPAIPILSIKVIYTVCPAIAVIVTAVRLWVRATVARIWWDDNLAFMAAIFIILTCVGGWLHFDAEQIPSQATRVAAYYLLAQTFYATLWSARLSILYSIIRIASNPSTKKLLHWLAVGFIAAWLALFSQLWWVCVPMHNHWMSLPSPQCPLTVQVVILQLVSDILADLLLIVVPVRLFLNSRLDAGIKTRLVIIFSASILTTVVSLVHAYYLLRVGGADVLIAAIVETAVSLIVCNLSVLVTAGARLCRRRRADGADSVPVSIAKSSRSGDAPLALRTFGGTEVRVQKERATFLDIASFSGKARGDGDYDTEDAGKPQLHPETQW